MAEKKEEELTPLEQAGFEEEVAEDFLNNQYGAYVKTGFPQPYRRLRLVYESQQASVEHTYFWMFNSARQDFGFGDIIKTVDTFGASENSSFWGLTEQRKGLQQDKASQYLATIGRMVKELFQIVREIRILRERLRLYKEAAEGKHASDIALKGYWVDMVEGGTKGGANIYVMASQLGFGTLPDLFFGIYVKDDADIDRIVADKAKEFNNKVQEVLKRKLAAYMAWKKETYKELLVRERFTIRFLRQHWAVIRMYMAWVKPYLRNVQKLHMPDQYDRNPELISSFEGALMEIEFLARRSPNPKWNKDMKKSELKVGDAAATILATFTYRVRPQLSFQAEGYQRGAVHVGRVEVSLRSYGWTKEETQKYLEYREKETLQLIGMVDQSIKDAMDALGDELMQYLKEAGEDVGPIPGEKKEEKPKEQKLNLFEPFTALYDGFKDMIFMPFDGLDFGTKEKKASKIGMGNPGLAKDAAGMSFQMYKNYKKSHGMVAW